MQQQNYIQLKDKAKTYPSHLGNLRNLLHNYHKLILKVFFIYLLESKDYQIYKSLY